MCNYNFNGRILKEYQAHNIFKQRSSINFKKKPQLYILSILAFVALDRLRNSFVI